MPNMFPTMVADPNDPNRRHVGPVGDTWPAPLKVGYWLILIAAVLMLVTGMMMLVTEAPDVAEDVRSKFLKDVRVVAIGDLILGLALASCAAYFPRGSKNARRWAAGFIALGLFLNFVGFFFGVAGWASFVIGILLALSVFFLFRPEANAFVDEKSGDLWRGVS